MFDKIETRIQIVIPAYNDAEVIDETIQSIKNQEFDENQVYIVIVDFGSQDGTYEKIMGYDAYHLGIYQINKDFTKRRMISEAMRMAGYTYPGGEYCYQMVLIPGDIIYPSYLSRMSQLMYQYRGYNLSMVISETDIVDSQGQMYHRPNLYEQEKLIDGKNEYIDYISKGSRQNVMCFGGEFAVGNHCVLGIRNERIWWNKNLQANYTRNVVYIPERLGCIRERFYEDELEELLLSWNNWIDFARTRESAFGIQMTGNENKDGERSLADYALWRSFLLMQKNDFKQARECFLMAGIIYQPIKQDPVYSWLSSFVLEDNRQNYEKIKEYYDCRKL